MPDTRLSTMVRTITLPVLKEHTVLWKRDIT